MRTFWTLLILMLCSLSVEAKDSSKTLNDAVNQAKSEGKVLSAKTVNGRHEVKVLTPNGSVKTIRHQAQKHTQRPNYYQKGGRSMRDRKQNSAIPNRFSEPSRNNSARNSHNNSVRNPRQSRSASSNSGSKDKDK